jgi:pilus assembly protein CpaB
MKKAVLITSLGAALGSALLGHLYFTRLEAEVSGGAKIPVLVAAEDVPLGATLTEKVIAVRDVPQAYLDSRQVRASDARKVLGTRLASVLKANETVLWSDLAASGGQVRVLSSLVERGMRAVAIDSKTGTFDGLLRPGDRVDVLFTEGGKGNETGSTITLLQNLLVLSVGSNIAKADDAPGRIASSFGTVTLSATIEQAQLITQAKERGRLSLTLRNSDDIQLTDSVGETSAKDLTASAFEARAKRAAGAVDGASHVR